MSGQRWQLPPGRPFRKPWGWREVYASVTEALGTGADVWPHTAVLPLPWDWRLQAVAWAVLINGEMLMHQHVKKHTQKRCHREPSPHRLLPLASVQPGSTRQREAT